MTFTRRTTAWLAACGLAAALAGCSKTEPTTAVPTGQMYGGQAGQSAPGGPGGPAGEAKVFDADSEPHAAGKKAMVAANCFNCHAVDGARPSRAGGKGPGGPGGGPGGKMGGGRAPDLGHAGKDADHTAEWLAKYIRNPKAVNPDAKMPPQEGRVKDEDIKAIADYLASLK